MESSDGRTVYVQPDEFIESALRRFKRVVTKADILAEIRRHEYHVSRSVRRRAKAGAARRRRERSV